MYVGNFVGSVVTGAGDGCGVIGDFVGVLVGFGVRVIGAGDGGDVILIVGVDVVPRSCIVGLGVVVTIVVVVTGEFVGGLSNTSPQLDDVALTQNGLNFWNCCNVSNTDAS